LGSAIGQYIIAGNLTKISFYNTLIGVIINVILNIILIPKMGINGAAIATLISYTMATFGIFFFKESKSQGLLMLKSIINYK
jgi:O-antigen/teichoic acid export membrane protein